MATILVIHGPNLNLLGQREPDVYGHQDLASLDATLQLQAQQAGHQLTTFQSNAEHELITAIHNAGDNDTNMIIINPAAYGHTSIALRDALLAVAIPFIEVHLSNIHARESFRHQTLLMDIASGVISGFGTMSYSLALTAAIEQLRENHHGHS